MSLAETRKRYDDWLAARDERPADIMAGIGDALHLPLDKAGLRARGWSDLPVDWVPEDGHLHIGGYGEDRAIYDTPIFNPAGDSSAAVAGRRRHAVRDGRDGTLDVDNKSVVPAGLRGRRPDPSSPRPLPPTPPPHPSSLK